MQRRSSPLARTSPCQARLALGLAGMLLALHPAVAWCDDAATSTNVAGAGWSGNLWLAQEYRLRTAGAAGPAGPLGQSAASPSSDQDLRLTVDATLLGLGERAAGNLSAALWLDLDGHLDQGGADPLTDAQGWTRAL